MSASFACLLTGSVTVPGAGLSLMSLVAGGRDIVEVKGSVGIQKERFGVYIPSGGNRRRHGHVVTGGCLKINQPIGVRLCPRLRPFLATWMSIYIITVCSPSLRVFPPLSPGTGSAL